MTELAVVIFFCSCSRFEYEHTQEELENTKRVSRIRKSKDRLTEKGKQNKQPSTKHYTEN